MSRASDHAYNRIREMIMTGDLAAGTQIREEQLALACGVSRTPVRDAMRRLEADHFIFRNDSQRRFVTEWSREDAKDSFELRTILESLAAKRAAERITGEEIVKLKQYNREIFSAVNADQPNVPAFLEANRKFHAAIEKAAASRRLKKMLGAVIEQPLVLRTALQYDQTNLMRAYHEHAELIAAFESNDGEWASAVMTAHIRRAFQAYMSASQQSGKSHSTDIAA